MQVILLDDVERVGHEGDVITVADGYARNYLIPRKMAVPATKGALKDLERRAKAIAAREEVKRAKAQSVAEELANLRVVVKARAGQGQRLHGQVTPQMIVEAAKEQIHVEIDRRDIEIAEPIRELGDYLVGVRLYKDVHAQLPVSVVSEAAEEPHVAAAPPAAVPEEETGRDELQELDNLEDEVGEQETDQTG